MREIRYLDKLVARLAKGRAVARILRSAPAAEVSHSSITSTRTFRMNTIPPPVVVRTQMLIRRPVAVVFEAFVDPAVTSRFWFTRGSGRLVPGATVVWSWDWYGAEAKVAVKVIETNRRIVVAWPSPVEWTFGPETADTTLVTITAQGFAGNESEPVARALDAMGGFSYLLAGCKAYLEHGLILHLVRDHNPAGHVDRRS